MRIIKKLTDTKIRSLQEPGRYNDGNGLYLNIAKGGSKSWVFLWRSNYRRRETGLGGYPVVSLSKARQRAMECLEMIAEGRDPIAEKRKAVEPSFAECAGMFLDSMEGKWRNEKHRAQWRSTLDTYCKPIEHMGVSKIDTEQVLRVLQPIWTTKSETASRLRGRMERVLDFAKTKGWRSGENPAGWRNHLKNVLPARQRLTRGHHKALSWKDMPELIGKLRSSDAVAAAALEFLILTAARTGEVLGATFSEIDAGEAVWIVPADRMKANKEHRVPLTPRALYLASKYNNLGDYLYPGQSKGKAMSNMSMSKVLKRLGYDVTVHGMRSAFRDWVGDATGYPEVLAEMALAHTVGDETERAYRRGDALERRRELMMTWARYLEGEENVVKFEQTSA